MSITMMFGAMVAGMTSEGIKQTNKQTKAGVLKLLEKYLQSLSITTKNIPCQNHYSKWF